MIRASGADVPSRAALWMLKLDIVGAVGGSDVNK